MTYDSYDGPPSGYSDDPNDTASRGEVPDQPIPSTHEPVVNKPRMGGGAAKPGSLGKVFASGESFGRPANTSGSGGLQDKILKDRNGRNGANQRDKIDENLFEDDDDPEDGELRL